MLQYIFFCIINFRLHEQPRDYLALSADQVQPILLVTPLLGTMTELKYLG